MPKVEVSIELEQIAKVLQRLTPGEVETLEILLNPKLQVELKDRWKKGKEELREGKTLSKEKLFSE